MASFFQEWVEYRHEKVRQWKEDTGGKAYGYLCCMTPEEILYAAGVLPAKVMGAGEAPQEIVDKHLVRYACPYVRSMLDAAGRGEYSYLDSVVVCNSCDIMSRVEYYWRTMKPHPKSTILGVELSPYVLYIKSPEKISGPGVHEYLRSEFRIFKQHLERDTKQVITDDMLESAISVYNEHYDLMRKLHDLRKEEPLKVSGSEAFVIELSSLLMRKDLHNQKLAAHLKNIETREPFSGNPVRLFLSGGGVDHFTGQIYTVIEEAGGQVVAEDIGVGSSWFGHGIDTDKPPMDAIVAHRLDVHCPHTMTSERHPRERFEYVKSKIKDANVKGAVFFVPMYCECRNLEYPFIKEGLRDELGIPTLYLDSDYSQGSLDEAVSKIEAFIEMLEE